MLHLTPHLSQCWPPQTPWRRTSTSIFPLTRCAGARGRTGQSSICLLPHQSHQSKPGELLGAAGREHGSGRVGAASQSPGVWAGRASSSGPSAKRWCGGVCEGLLGTATTARCSLRPGKRLGQGKHKTCCVFHRGGTVIAQEVIKQINRQRANRIEINPLQRTGKRTRGNLCFTRFS